MPRFSLDRFLKRGYVPGDDNENDEAEPTFDTPDLDYSDDYGRDGGDDWRGDYDYQDDYGYSEDDGYGEDDPYGDEYVEYDEDGYPIYPEEDPEGYDDGPAYAPRGVGAVVAYVMEHDWVTWALLALLPPLGIWLLWRRGMLNRNGRLAFSLLSAIWLVVALVLLFGRPQNPDEAEVMPQTIGRQSPTEAPEEAEPAATAEPEVADADAVYVTPAGSFYHLLATCPQIGSESANRVARTAAQEAGLMSCPYCAGSAYGVADVIYMNNDTVDVSGIQVYCAPGDSRFHLEASCPSAVSNARLVGLKEALLMNKTACDSCCPTAARQVYCTADGTYYHKEDDCSGMRNARVVTYAEARVLGKVRCPKCIGGTPETNVAPTAESAEEDTTYYVYATPNGQYYHIDEHCTGMQNAQRYPLKDMLASGRPGCPTCCGAVEMTVFASRDNPYYHSNATCSGMTNAVSGQLVQALAAGLTRCPVCWLNAS